MAYFNLEVLHITRRDRKLVILCFLGGWVPVTYRRIFPEYLVTKSDFLWDVAPCDMVNSYQLFGGHVAGIFSIVILRWRWKKYVTPK